MIAGAGIDNGVFDIVFGDAGLVENLGDFFLRLPGTVWVVEVALRLQQENAAPSSVTSANTLEQMIDALGACTAKGGVQ